MHQIDLRAIDLNLLVVLHHLLEDRSVSRTAQRIGRTQSATSHALARLREQLQDPLLVRVGDRMHPTPRAAQLAPELERILRALTRALEGGDDFDPETTDRVFTLAGPDFLAARVPALAEGLLAEAPRARVELLAPRAAMFQEVVEGGLDLAVAPPRAKMAGLLLTPLTPLDWVVYARRGHPGAKRWGRRAWARYGHVQIRTAGDRGPVDVAAEGAGCARTVAVWLPGFQSAASLLARTDLLLTAPRGVLGDLEEAYDLRTLRCPLPVPPIRLAVHRAAHLARDPAVTLWHDLVAGVLGDDG